MDGQNWTSFRAKQRYNSLGVNYLSRSPPAQFDRRCSDFSGFLSLESDRQLPAGCPDKFSKGKLLRLWRLARTDRWPPSYYPRRYRRTRKLDWAIKFYFLQRKTEKNPWTPEPRAPEPIFNVTFDGETLLFEVSHRRAHPPQSLNDPPKHYRLKLNGPNTAEGVNLDESGPALRLVRSDY